MKRFVKKILPSTQHSRKLFAAVVMGAALSSMGAAQGHESVDPKAIQEITRYCQTCWRNAKLPQHDWSDCTQEVFARLLRTIDRSKWDAILKQECNERKEFLRTIDAVKKRTQRAKRYSLLTDELSQKDQLGEQKEWRDQLGEVLQEALTERQVKIIEFTREGYSISEIARELQTTVDRVSDEKYKAIQRLRKYLNISNEA